MTVIDTTEPSLTIVKSMNYRGSPEEWSNTYFMDGALPSSSASWKTLADAVIAEEKSCYSAETTVVRAMGHQAGQSVAVWSWDYLALGTEVAGTLTATTPTSFQAGDAAAWIRWSTDQLTSKGKPIYLRSYFHDVFAGSAAANRDLLDAGQAAALLEYGQDWVAGFVDGDGVTHHRAGPHGVIGLVPLASTYLTTRTLERRGKRP
jgi:hypothetical protein